MTDPEDELPGPEDRRGDTDPIPLAGRSGAGSRAVASIEQERGRWVVHLSVIRADGVLRRRIEDYPTRRRAEIAARWIERGANRDLGPRGL